ncbi:MAG: hypothetical protein IJG32_06245 [Selenomonadaceae bacterium]|nr:hypothetical protein [Selenomonadaceae bacterium]
MDNKKKYIEDRIDELESEVSSLKNEIDSLRRILANFNERIKEISDLNEQFKKFYKDNEKLPADYNADFSKTFPRSNEIKKNIRPSPQVKPGSPIISGRENPPREQRNFTQNPPRKIYHGTAVSSQEPFISYFNNLKNFSGKDFNEQYRSFIRDHDVKAFSCEDVAGRMNNPNLPLIFSEVPSAKDGDFWAVPAQGNKFAVLPNPRPIDNDNFHVERAMRDVFESNFQPGNTYDKIQVERPAIFTRTGKVWNLMEKGHLILE